MPAQLDLLSDGSTLVLHRSQVKIIPRCVPVTARRGGSESIPKTRFQV